MRYWRENGEDRKSREEVIRECVSRFSPYCIHRVHLCKYCIYERRVREYSNIRTFSYAWWDTGNIVWNEMIEGIVLPTFDKDSQQIKWLRELMNMKEWVEDVNEEWSNGSNSSIQTRSEYIANEMNIFSIESSVHKWTKSNIFKVFAPLSPMTRIYVRIHLERVRYLFFVLIDRQERRVW